MAKKIARAERSSEKKFLGEFELYVMLAIARLGDGAYGGAVRREIEERASRPVAIGALYATLERLADKGLLLFETPPPEPGQRGRARKYCHLTVAGHESLAHSAEMLRRMMDGVDWAAQKNVASQKNLARG
ncbi:MAG: PadR family transcriptional regulator [Holophagales bacterium]|nr:PadR family transcriptional regulator [Holophagales bacterium]